MSINEVSLFTTDLVEQIEDKLYVDSLTIAENTGNQHKNVLELIKKYAGNLGRWGRVAFKTRPFETNGGIQKREIALLNENQSIFLIMLLRNSEEVLDFKERLVNAFAIMKERLARQSYQIPQSLSQALKEHGETLLLASRQAEQIEKQEEQLRLNAPKVEFYDKVIKVNDLIAIGDVAKVLDYDDIGRNKLFSILRDLKVLQSNNVPYQKYVKNGYFKVNETYINQNKIVLTTKVTQKGVEYINKLLKKYEAKNEQ